jgi:pimeloyl-ACP methyl ester carboxylesterase
VWRGFGYGLAAVALALAASAAARSSLARSQPCPDAPGFTCSKLSVPLDWSGRTAGRLSLRVAVRVGGGSLGTLVFLTGGPGQPGVPSASVVARRLARPFAGYRLVFLDQRGTGAGALDCPALQRQMGFTDLAVPTRSAVTSCARAIGPKRQFFSTAATVHDLDALRASLGADKLVLDGVSYGTLVAERYAIAHPNRVARLVLDSVVPHEGADPFERANAHASARVLRAVCRARGCSGDPAADLAYVVRRRKVGPALLNALTVDAVIDPSYTGVPEALHAARRGSWRALDELLARLGPETALPARLLSQGLHASTLCADSPMPWGGPDASLALRSPALRRATARIAPRAVWPFDRATVAGNGLLKTCLWWPPTPARPRPARELPPVPTLLLAGDRDLSTPLEWAREEAARAPRGRLVVVAGAGHSVQMRAVSEAGRAAVVSFLH